MFETHPTRKPESLDPHPKNDHIYGDRTDLQEAFLDSIAKNGIRNPIIITPDGVIISGHRRWEAAKQLDIDKIPVDVREYPNERARIEALIDFGRHRDKTFRQKMREADELETIERARAQERQGTRTDLRENFPGGDEPEYGRRRDKIADKVGIGSGKTYRHARIVWEAANDGDPVAQHEVDRLNQGEGSVSLAYDKVSERQSTTTESATAGAIEPDGEDTQVKDDTDDGNTGQDDRNNATDGTLDPDDLILSAHQKPNAEVFPKVLDLHVPQGAVIADITYGRGTFWKRVPADAYDLRATDIDPEKSPNSDDGVDYRDLPYSDGEIDAVVLDPPYMEGFYDDQRSGNESDYWIKDRYANATDSDLTYHEAVLNEYVVAGREAHRVLREDGVLIAKLQDEVSRNEQRLTHIEVTNIYEEKIGFSVEDLFVVVRQDTPTAANIKRQRRARKNHSYFMVYVKEP